MIISTKSNFLIMIDRLLYLISITHHHRIKYAIFIVELECLWYCFFLGNLPSVIPWCRIRIIDCADLFVFINKSLYLGCLLLLSSCPWRSPWWSDRLSLGSWSRPTLNTHNWLLLVQFCGVRFQNIRLGLLTTHTLLSESFINLDLETTLLSIGWLAIWIYVSAWK
jgi:hypothetical protein